MPIIGPALIWASIPLTIASHLFPKSTTQRLKVERLGMIDFRHLALDGQKIQASASFRNNMDRARAEKQLERIRKGMEKLLEQKPTDSLPQEKIDERLKWLERKEIRLAQTLAVLESFEDGKASMNMVDPDARIPRIAGYF